MELALDKEERIILKTRKHWVILVRDTIGTIFVGVLPFMFFSGGMLAGMIPESVFVYSPALVFASSLWALLVWMALSVIWTNYYLDIWIVTNRRIFNIEQVGLFHRRVATWNLDRIQEVAVRSENIMQNLFGYGTVQVMTAGPSDENVVAEGIPRPNRVRNIMLRELGRIGTLEETTKRQEGLIHTIGHEVKGYLAKNEAALAGIVEGDYGKVPDNLKHMADSALSETRQGVSTVMNVLQSSNAAEGVLKLEKRPFDMKEAAQQLAESFRKKAEERGIVFDFIASGGSFMVEGDETKMRELVFRNIIENALHYTPSGAINVVVTSLGSRVLFGVKDTGVGLTEADKEHLFTEGGKGDRSTAHNPNSTGYGLFIAKQIVDAHGGKIWATSDGRNKGTLFLVELPAAT